MDDKQFKSILNGILSEGILEETPSGVLSPQPSSDKYTPTTITEVPPLQVNNGSVRMSQTDDGMSNKPNTLLYPFESIFDTLTTMYTDLDNVLSLYKSAKEFPTASKSQKASLANGYDRLDKMQKQLEVSIREIGSMNV